MARENLRRTIEESGASVACREMPQVERDRVELVALFQNQLGAL